MAVIHIVGPASLFYRYWRISFIDFVASMLSFWITLFVSTEMGIAIAVIFSIGYTLIRSAFPKVKTLSATSGQDRMISRKHNNAPSTTENIFVPEDTMLVSFTDSIFFPNASRVKKSILESVKVQFEPQATVGKSQEKSADRSWSVASIRRVDMLRKRNNVTPSNKLMSVMVWDLTHVSFIDVTGVQSLYELREEIKQHVGKEVSLRLVGMNNKSRRRFSRAGWKVIESREVDGGIPEDVDVVFERIEAALWDRDYSVEREKVGLEEREHNTTQDNPTRLQV